MPLDGARVGVIGTGLDRGADHRRARAARAGHYCLFQRTAQWVLPQANNAYSEEERARYASDPELLRTMHDNLAEAFGAFATAVIDADSQGMAMIEQLCRENLETVEDPELRERLRPDYRAGCKRLVVSPDFYAAMQAAARGARRRRRSNGWSPPACAPSTASCTSSTCWCSPPGSTPTRSCGRWR